MHEQDSYRLIIDPPQSGAWNMAVDEALMHSVGEVNDQSPVLRFYRWSEPTLSLGYFQKSTARQEHQSSHGIDLVRRNSGGGAIVHDQELTYSLTVPQTLIGADRVIAKSTDLYSVMHDTLIESLADFQVAATKVEVLEKEREGNFLCFQRRAPNDVLVAGQKVCGSAQRKKYDAISQHGSVILRTSSKAPEIAGISELSGMEIKLSGLIETWTELLAGKLGIGFEPSKLTDKENLKAQEIADVKFSALKWTDRR